MSELEYWIWFSSLNHLRSRTRIALLERFGGAKEIYFAEEQALRKMEGIQETELSALLNWDTASAAQTLSRCGELGVDLITMRDAAYPERLRSIPDPPCVLYVKGRLPAVDSEMLIAVVGTRRCTLYGEKMARNIAYEIASGGGIVVTGLAAGIDSRAAEGALMAGGTVVGVLGVAINDVYPKYNGRLYADVCAAGALVSEYPPDARGGPENFSRRNRIMAGLSVGAVVAEAPLRSGALITVRFALDYGRDVFAVPGNADAPASRGCNQLLREGAIIAECGADVLREYAARFPEKLSDPPEKNRTLPDSYAIPEENRNAEARAEPEKKGAFWRFRTKNRARTEPDETAKPEPKAKQPTLLQTQLESLNEAQLKIVSALKDPDMHIDDIVDASGLPAATVLSELTMLQIKGYVTQRPGKRFSLNIAK
ncbi:MAG: DNA-processing protein DprA [Oscillospiraceae bacterium]|nr:DNA-processing protein DprA [Oscillospiraceae bacterium]